jgi:hypothetical protein
MKSSWSSSKLVSCLTYSLNLKMEAISSSETSLGFHRTTWRYIREHVTLHNRQRENLKSRLFRFIRPSYASKLPSFQQEDGENWIMRMTVHVARMGDLRISFAGCFTTLPVARDSSVGIATGYGLDDPGGGSSSPGRVKNFHLYISSRPALGSTPTSYKMGTGGSFPGVKRQGREADHSPPTSAEVKKMWIYSSTPTHVFMV